MAQHLLSPIETLPESKTCIGGYRIRCSCGLNIYTSLSARMCAVEAAKHLAYHLTRDHYRSHPRIEFMDDEYGIGAYLLTESLKLRMANLGTWVKGACGFGIVNDDDDDPFETTDQAKWRENIVLLANELMETEK